MYYKNLIYSSESADYTYKVTPEPGEGENFVLKLDFRGNMVMRRSVSGMFRLKSYKESSSNMEDKANHNTFLE